MTVLEYLKSTDEDIDVYDDTYDEGCAFCYDSSEPDEPIDFFNLELYKRLNVTHIGYDCICADVCGLVNSHYDELVSILNLDGDHDENEEYLVHFLLYAQAGYTNDRTYESLTNAMKNWK